MNWYLLLVFVHVSSAVGMFAAWAVEGLLLQRLRSTDQLDEARTSARQLGKYARVAPAAMLVLLVTGMAMMTQWGHQPWMIAAFGAMVVMGAIGGSTGRRMGRRIEAALTGDPAVAVDTISAAAGSLTLSLQLRLAIGVGIIGLMTMKPGTEGALVILGIATVAALALAAGGTLRRGARQEEEPAGPALSAR